MKLTYLLPILLLLAVPVGAVELYSGDMCRDGGLWFPARANGMCYTADIPRAMDACYQRMAAAMRAMEPWIIFYAQGSQVKNQEIAAEVRAAWDQWNTAKRDCWRTP